MAARLTAFLVAVIVGISVVAGLIVGAQREADPAVDLLIYNGRVYTGDPAAPMAEAVAVKGNRILRVGTNREIKRLRRNAATVIDAHGGSVLPGFADTYVALPGQAEAIAGAHRLGLTSVGAIVEDLAALDGLRELTSTGNHPMRIAAALKVTLPLSEAFRSELDRVREKTRTTPDLVTLDALAFDVRVPPAKPSRASARRAPKAALLPIEQQQALLALDRAGWPLVLHVADEPGLATALDAVAGLIETNDAPTGGRRHRLVLAHPMPLDTARLATLGLTVAMPLPATWPALAADTPATPDTAPASEAAHAAPAVDQPAPAAEAVQAAADPAALPFAFPLPSGVQLVMGSEIIADPRLGLQALLGGAVVPGSPAAAPGDDEHEAPAADRALVASALATLTTGAAQVLGAGAEWGTVAPGQLADLVVLSADLFELPASRMLDAVVTATVVDGKVVYDRDTDTPPPPTP
jgi:predicted amidohydrolase YtcJ